MKITLAICTNRSIKPKTLQGALDLVLYSRDVAFHVLVADRGYTIAENRNYCVVQAQKNGSDYLLFIDDDMTFPPNTLEELLSHRKDVVGVNAYSRCLPLSSTVGLMDAEGNYKHPDKHTDYEMQVPKHLFEAYFVGCGVCLIDMSVFARIDTPYFEFTYEESGIVKDGEDGNFCRKVRDAGMSVWCDGALEIGHLGEYEYKRDKSVDFSTFQES